MDKEISDTENSFKFVKLFNKKNYEIFNLDIKFLLSKLAIENSIVTSFNATFCALVSIIKSSIITEGYIGCQFTSARTKEESVPKEVFIKKE